MNEMSWNSDPTSLELKAQEVHVWRATLDDIREHIDHIKNHLSETERQTASQFRFDRHRNRYESSHAILRKILHSYLGFPPAEFRFKRNDYGKPTLSPNPLNINFNLSHSGNMALFGFTRKSSIGIDIEQVRPLDDYPIMTRSFMSPGEREELLHLPEHKQLDFFYRVWTKKEALSKAMGKGISLPMDQWEVDLDAGSSSVFKVNQRGNLSTSNWYVINLKPAEGYAGAIAIDIPFITVKRFTFA
jgi:4'-phosphopantetheinyl transferase